MKALAILGTRPEAIKLAPVLQEFKRRMKSPRAVGNGSSEDENRVMVCCTGQHRVMVDDALKLFGIVPDCDLQVMSANQTPSRVAAAVLERLEILLERERPEWVLVQGDTTSAMAASLAAFHAKVKVGHVEAGLRTYDKWQPFPEEINRRITGLLSDLHCAPTQLAQQNLLREGADPAKVFVTGNPVVDALLWVAHQPAPSGVEKLLREIGLPNTHGGNGASPRSSWASGGDPRLVLVTAHRRENHGRPLENICVALRRIAEHYRGSVRVVYSVHMNPNVTEVAHRVLASAKWVTLTPPLDYAILVNLMKRASVILTDSGGIQEEAPSLGKPVLVLREVTERPEAVEAGTVKVVGTDPSRIFQETSRLLDDDDAYERMARAVNPYGDGEASRRIVSALLGEAFDAFRPECGTTKLEARKSAN
jgi:UDP-N-acetylglucosamine 2-epimerase (non-hydrolysing)